MKLRIKRVVRYSVQSACNCPKGTQTDCGINYRSG